MKLEKLHVFQREACSNRQGRTVSGIGMCIGGYLKHSTEAAGSEHDRFGPKRMQLTGCKLDSEYPRTNPTRHYQLHHLELVEKMDIVFDTLLIECLQYHVPGPIGRITGAPNRCFSEVSCMSSESPLIDFAFGRSAKRQSSVFQIVYGLNGFFSKDDCCRLVYQIISPFDRIECVPFGLILFDISQGSTDPTLCGTGMASYRVEFGEHSGFDVSTRFQSSI
jgi:hypothetical protein